MEKVGEQPKLPQTKAEKETGRRIIVVLENASLETVKTNKGYHLLSADDHRSLHKKHKKDPSESRPDILHSELLSLMDSPLNKAGLLQVYIRSSKNVLIEVNPKARIPRTYKRFAGLMVQLLHKLSVRAANSSETLLKVVKNPVTRHLPTNCRKYCGSVTGSLVNMHEMVKTVPDNEPVVFVIGAMAHGHITEDIAPYVDEFISVSEYPLSGAQAISRILGAFENHWGII